MYLEVTKHNIYIVHNIYVYIYINLTKTNNFL